MNIENGLNQIIIAAFNEAKLNNHQYLTPEHLLYSSLFFEEGKEIIENCGGDTEILKKILKKYLDKEIEVKEGAEPIQTYGFQQVVTWANSHVIASAREEIKWDDVLVAIYDLEESYGSYFLKEQEIKRIDLLNYIAHGVSVTESIEFEDIEEEFDEEYDGTNELYEDEIEDNDFHSEIGEQVVKINKKILSNYTVELTEKARKGLIDPLIGREDILNRTIQVLSRRTKNNPVHVGEPGVGKTALTEGLANLIVHNKVPKSLENSKIFMLDMGTMLAGTKYRGDFEERVKNVLNEIKKYNRAIVYVDEIHTVVGAGSTSGGSMDASNLLKPYLSDGSIRFIGSTTYDEYKKYFEKDKALLRRFQKIEVPETSVEETLGILQGLKENYEMFHGVRYTDKALEAAVELSSKYINDRFLPDKAIDVIDEAGAFVRLEKYKEEKNNINEKLNDEGDNLAILKKDEISADEEKSIKEYDFNDLNEREGLYCEDEYINVTEKEIEKLVASIAKIPEQSVSSDDVEKLKNLDKLLKKRIYGQDKAIEVVTKAIKRSRAGFNDEDKTIANLLFVGPTGVGKTEVSKQLADAMGIPLVRFDMSEYQEKHTVARLIGAPPGYVGYEEGGLLTDAIRKSPHCVLLMDEIEKVHPDVLNVLLQLMDYATLTDNTGKKADFRNVILIMTSNAGARNIGKSLLGFGSRKIEGEAINEEVEKFFSPEFRNRLDDIVIFNSIDDHMAQQIAEKAVKDFEKKLKKKNVSLEVTERCYKWIVEKGFSTEYGAREINRVVQSKIKPYFVDAVLFGELSEGGTAVLDIENDEVKISKK